MRRHPPSLLYLLLLTMIFTVPLQAGTVLANVLYKWIANGSAGAPSASGITQPDANFAVFRIDSTPPAGAEEMVAYDSTDLTNWNAAGYRAGLAAVAAAQQIMLVSLWQPSAGPQAIVPAGPAQDSVCQVFGVFNDLSSLNADGVSVTFTLVQQDGVNPDIIYDLTAVPLRNTETGKLLVSRVVNATITAGQLTDVNANAYVVLTRTDYIKNADGTAISNLKYLLTAELLGAPLGLSLGSSGGPTTFSPVLFPLDVTNTSQRTGGTFDLATLVTT